MKKIYTLVLFVITFFSGNAQIVDIPDGNFKAKLLQASPENAIAVNAEGQYIKIDINDDGEIQENEALSVFQLDVSFSDIQNLVGIEAFLNLTGLKCEYNQLTSLDVTQNVALENIYCNSNQLTSLDVTQNVALGYINCSYNQLTSLNVTQNVSLYLFECSNNQLISLDVSQNSALIFLKLKRNPNRSSSDKQEL